MIITADASGDALSTTVSVAKEGNIKRVLELSSYNSIASYYSYVTQICGYKPSKHEGKITGLAAHGTPKYFNVFQKMIKYENGRIVNRSNSRHDMTLQKIKKRIKNYSKEDLAASVQCHLEENISKFISYWVHKTKISDVIVAGGIFANVKLNQRIAEIPTVESFFAHPHMGDGGIGVGAALYISMQEQLDKGSFKPYKLQNVYFGPEFSNAKIEEAITISGLKGENIKNIEKYVAEKIAQKKIVGHFNGRMEYGPRALGNRSILADPTDTTINDWLNKRLHRTEFMPFAPSILDTGAPNYYKKYEKSAYPAQFMTITFDTTKKALKAKAVVHIDHTTRPQVVSKEQNPRYYKILQLHKQITGLPLFVNTSFNIHEEPIVCTPADAIKSFNQGCVDVLVMGNWVIEK